MKNYIVLNTSKATVERFGILFPAGEKTSVKLTREQFVTLANIKGLDVFEIATKRKK